MAFQGKVALITGAANGIERAIAKRFLDEGAAVVGLDIERENILKLGEQFNADSDRFVPVVADVSKRADVREAVAVAIR
ncbi:hypothetical protein BH23CHL5_BH23CHL5_01020 [soil metagenome]